MLDKKYNSLEKEEKWLNYWKENKIYEFKPDQRKVYSIDTPPPTVNGKIHIGHIFSYSQAEMIARYKRISGYNVFYPFGFDDNGLPSERLVEKEQGKKAHEIGRENFSKLCYETTDKYETEFQDLFSRLGVSTDWSMHYKTVSPSTIKISQNSFLDLIEKGHCYHKESPALWCNECLTSIAQAELETKTIKTTFNYVNFETVEDGEKFTIATTRPELMPAIVCVFVNPNDEKNKHLIGKTAHIPVINVDVPIMCDEKAAIDKGTGIVMCCTFGDQTDIEWWKKYNLPLKYIFTDDGKIIDSVPNYGGLKIKEARKQILEAEERLPDYVIACVGGGSNAIGLFHPFFNDKNVKIIGVEPAGKGLDTKDHAASMCKGTLGEIHGFKCYLLQDENGDVAPVYSVAAGLDYPGVGPEHCYYKDLGRVEYVSITDDETIDTFCELSKTEGIIPAIESYHAVAYAMKLASTLDKDKIIIVSLSGRGDKDVVQVKDILRKRKAI